MTVTAPVVVVPTVTRKTLSARAYFRAYSAVLTASGLKAIAVLARNTKRFIASGYVFGVLIVKGYVQPTSFTYNDKSLSTARAKAVAEQLRKLGIRGAVKTGGMGRSSSTTAAGRRADAVIPLSLTR